MNVTELHSAYVWDCDACGRENFLRAVETDLDEPTAKAVLDQGRESMVVLDPQFGCIVDDADANGADWMVARVVLAPRTVVCGHCACEYSTELPTGTIVDEDTGT